MIDLPMIDCSIIDRYEIANKVLDSIENVDPTNKILRLKVQNLPIEIYKTLDFNQFRSRTTDALHFEIQYAVTTDTDELQAPSIKFDMLGNEFKSFLATEAIEGLDKNRLVIMGLDYLTVPDEESTKE
jgi:hypothetical protein